MSLSIADYKWAADELCVEVPAIMAVDEVESNGSGFLDTGEPKILYEPHIFHRHTDGKYDGRTVTIEGRLYPLSYPKWRPGTYGLEGHQHRKLQAAVELDRDAALQSCSWGRYQILGENWKALGYESLQHFVNDMYESERKHLEAFVRFIRVNKLDKHLRHRNWARFAHGYNGVGYAVHNYHGRMQEAYDEIVGVA